MSGNWAWPVHKSSWSVLASGAALLIVVWSAVGLAYMALLDDGPVGDADRAGAQWMEERRTPAWNDASHVGSMLSDTLVKVVLVAIVGVVMLALWRRWHDAVFLVLVVSFEATVFVISSVVVGRERPPVERLDPAAPSGSFPSGHAAAAVAFYAGVFVVVCWHSRHRGVRIAFAVVAVVVPLIVAVSRVARGMHYPLDVIAGLLLGVASIVVVRAALAAGAGDLGESADRAPPDHDRSASTSGATS